MSRGSRPAGQCLPSCKREIVRELSARRRSTTVQLVYFPRAGGMPCLALGVTDTTQLAKFDDPRIDCRGGQEPQIGGVLRPCRPTRRKSVRSAEGDGLYRRRHGRKTFDKLCRNCGRNWRCAKPRASCFTKVIIPAAATGFSRKSPASPGGAYGSRFDQNAAAELAALLRAVATYATGGRPALEKGRRRGCNLAARSDGAGEDRRQGETRGQGSQALMSPIAVFFGGLSDPAGGSRGPGQCAAGGDRRHSSLRASGDDGGSRPDHDPDRSRWPRGAVAGVFVDAVQPRPQRIARNPPARRPVPCPFGGALKWSSISTPAK